MGIPEIIPKVVPVVLRDPLGKPGGDQETGDGIRHDDVRIAVEDVGSPLGLVSEPLKVDRGHAPPELHGGLHLDDVRKLVRDDIPEPVMRPPELIVHAGGVELDLVVEKVCRPVGNVVIVPYDEAHLLRRLVIIEGCYRLVDVFSDFCHGTARPLRPLVVVNEEVGRLNRLPDELRMVEVFLGREAGYRQDDEKQRCD